jgi:hypothetical protein
VEHSLLLSSSNQLLDTDVTVLRLCEEHYGV